MSFKTGREYEKEELIHGGAMDRWSAPDRNGYDAPVSFGAMFLLDPEDMPRFDKIDVPYKFYTVMKEPCLLAGMSYPWDRTLWRDFWHAGFTDVVCLLGSDHSYDSYPLEILHSADLVDLYGGEYPADPDGQEQLVR